jgi:hypothetical protein
VTSSPPTLSFLAYHWGDAYLLSSVRDRWVALRRDARYFLTANSLAELETLITADYRDNPVPRVYDPPQDADYLALPGSLTLTGDKNAHYNAGLDDETQIVLQELRRAFPAWTIVYSYELQVWIGTTHSTTICQRSALSLCIALTLIKRPERHLA